MSSVKSATEHGVLVLLLARIGQNRTSVFENSSVAFNGRTHMRLV